MKKIETWVDLGRAFVDENGSFYCGTTKEQKENTKLVAEGADLYIFASDIHSGGSSEFAINGGIYPVHNLTLKDQAYASKLGVEDGKTTSPQLTEILLDMVKDKKSGIIVPRHVFFQDYDGGESKPAFTFDEVRETFGVPTLKPQEFLDGGIEYIVNAKHLFNAAGLQETDWMGNFDGVPDKEMSVFSLLKQKYGQGQELSFNINGVVMGICIYNTASGIRQKFPKAEINVIADASTHLLVPEFGFKNETDANKAAKSMCQQIGVNYITTQQYLGGK